jgi:hypothetical protein
MQLTIKGPGGKVLQVKVAKDATVLDLKRAIEQAQPDISASNIRLIFSGKILATLIATRKEWKLDGSSMCGKENMFQPQTNA